MLLWVLQGRAPWPKEYPREALPNVSAPRSGTPVVTGFSNAMMPRYRVESPQSTAIWGKATFGLSRPGDSERRAMPRRPSRPESFSQLPEALLLYVLTFFSNLYNHTPHPSAPVTL